MALVKVPDMVIPSNSADVIGPVVDAANASAAVAIVNVSTVGGGTVTLDIYLQTTYDGATWQDLATVKVLQTPTKALLSSAPQGSAPNLVDANNTVFGSLVQTSSNIIGSGVRFRYHVNNPVSGNAFTLATSLFLK